MELGLELRSVSQSWAQATVKLQLSFLRARLSLPRSTQKEHICGEEAKTEDVPEVTQLRTLRG